MAKYVMGIDNGGTVSKAALFDLSGTQVAVASRKSLVSTPQPGYAERDMEELWQDNLAVIREAIAKSGVDARDILGVAFAGHGKGLYAWGQDGKPAGAGIVSTDNRAWSYAERWANDGTATAIYDRTCQKLIACQQASLLAWRKDYDLENYQKIKYVFSIKDYLRFRMTGQAFAEMSDMSGTSLMDIRKQAYDLSILQNLNIPEVYDALPPLKWSSDCCGFVQDDIAALTGLAAGTPVAGGMFDIDACAIAMNITNPNYICTIAGTWSINEYIASQPVVHGPIAMNSLYAIPGYFLVEECSATSAGNLEWFVSRMLHDGKFAGMPSDVRLYDYIDQQVESVAPESSDTIFLPFLYGSNSHPLAQGALIGLTNYHQISHVLRAVYEGVAFSHRSHIDKLLAARQQPKAIRMAGGAARSKTWVQVFADVLQMPVEIVATEELGALGASMSAAVAAGCFADYPAAAQSMVHFSGTVQPNPDRAAIYAKKYATYCAFRDALVPVWDRLA
jgi:L-xylulokinase